MMYKEYLSIDDLKDCLSSTFDSFVYDEDVESISLSIFMKSFELDLQKKLSVPLYNAQVRL